MGRIGTLLRTSPDVSYQHWLKTMRRKEEEQLATGITAAQDLSNIFFCYCGGREHMAGVGCNVLAFGWL